MARPLRELAFNSKLINATADERNENDCFRTLVAAYFGMRVQIPSAPVFGAII